MTNAELYGSNGQLRDQAFASFCKAMPGGACLSSHCPAFSDTGECIYHWLQLESGIDIHILKCPRCGGCGVCEHVFEDPPLLRGFEAPRVSRDYHVRCIGCCGSTAGKSTPNEAVLEWNMGHVHPDPGKDDAIHARDQYFKFLQFFSVTTPTAHRSGMGPSNSDEARIRHLVENLHRMPYMPPEIAISPNSGDGAIRYDPPHEGYFSYDPGGSPIWIGADFVSPMPDEPSWFLRYDPLQTSARASSDDCQQQASTYASYASSDGCQQQATRQQADPCAHA